MGFKWSIAVDKGIQGLATGGAGVAVAAFIVWAVSGHPTIAGNEAMLIPVIGACFTGLINAGRNWWKHRKD